MCCVRRECEFLPVPDNRCGPIKVYVSGFNAMFAATDFYADSRCLIIWYVLYSRPTCRMAKRLV